MSRAEVDQSSGRVPRWGSGDVLVGLVVAFAASTLVGSIALGASGEDDLEDIPMTVYALVQAAQYIGFVGIPLLATRLKGNGLVRDLGARMQARDVPIGIAIGVGLQLVMVPLVSYPWIWVLGRDANDLDDRAHELTDRASGFGLFMITLVVVVGAPFAEELFFRGLAMRSFQRRLGIGLGLVASAVLFSVTHLDLLTMPALFVFGLVAGYLAIRTGRLGLSWWTHLGFNATTMAILIAGR